MRKWFFMSMLTIVASLSAACSGSSGGEQPIEDAVETAEGDSTGQDTTPADLREPDDQEEPKCASDTDCAGLQGTACQEAVCNPQTHQCELEEISGCVVCSTVEDCPNAPVCYQSACDKGRCTVGSVADGTQCEDGSLCSVGDACQEGECVPGQQVVCEAPDACHAAGTCDDQTGECSEPAALTGAACDDQDACTQVDSCQEGVCLGSNPVVCVAKDQCHSAGVCDPSTGVCDDPEVENGQGCDDSNLCSLTDICQAGVCTGGDFVVCSAMDQCHEIGVCDPQTGVCSDPAKPDGTSCDDTNSCSQTDTCQTGVCTGSDYVVCQPLDQCHVAGECDPATGNCSNPNQADNQPCNDGNKCTQTDLCLSGVCEGSNPVVCQPIGQCYLAGDCIPETGYCTFPFAETGTACEEDDLCTVGDICTNGACITGLPMDCKDDNQCTTDSCQEGICQHLEVQGCIEEDCTDEVDNNGNGWIDCDDTLCSEDDACQQPVLGESCGLPYLVFGGQSVGVANVGQSWSQDGDNTGKNHDYPALCWQSPNMPDEVYRLDVAEPVRLRVTMDYNDPYVVKYSRVMIFKDVCFPENFQDCAYGGSVPAEYEDVFAPGTYFFVVTGGSYYSSDWGPYTFGVEVYTVETSETDCQDGVDNDGDGLADCKDPECYEVEGCEEVLVLDDLACGDTWTGTFLSLEESHYFTFHVEESANIAVYWTFAEGAKDYGYVNFYEAQTDPPRYDELWGTGETIWHVEKGAGFEASGNQTYVVMFELSELDQGTYSFTLACADVPEANCDDQLDNDADSWVDCEDPDCYDTSACNGGFSGETCETAIPVNGGAPITAVEIGDEGVAFTILGRNDTKLDDLEAACVAATSKGPDIVYTFTLDDVSVVSIGATFDDSFSTVPALYLFSGTCTPDAIVACGEPVFFTTGMEVELQPGTYYIVVDSGGVSWSGVPYQGPFSVDLYFDVPATPEVCDNTLDEDGDGRIDCQDPECFDDELCVGYNSGEHCGDPFRLNGSDPLPADYAATFYNTTIGKGDHLGYACAPVSYDGPDAVQSFRLDTESLVTLKVQFEDGFTPSVMLFPSSCGDASLLRCATAEWDTVTMSDILLPAGEYNVVVDSGDDLFGTPMAANYTLFLTTIPEECSNGLDDDGDGRTDCEDPYCFALEACTGGLSGEDCTTPFLMNEGAALAADGDYLAWQTTVGKANDYSASCSTASATGGDAVHAFVLEAAMIVDVSVYFDNQTYPSIYLYSGTCAVESLLGCDLGTWSVAAIETLELQPGTYYVVVDSGMTGASGVNTSDYVLTVTTQTPSP